MEEAKYIHVRVTTNAKKEVVQKKKNIYIVTVKEKAKEGRANKRVRELLSHTFGCSPQHLRMVKGATTPSKTYLLTNQHHHEN